MPFKNNASRRASRGAKAAMVKRLVWDVKRATADTLQSVLQDFTDVKWRVFAIMPNGSDYLVTAYLNGFTEAETPTDAEAES